MEWSSATLACAVGVAALVAGVVRRLYFSPLSHIPGPKLAALTSLGELYWSYFKSGQYLWKIEEMHQKYGPIVRINPVEVHIKDSSFFDDLYVVPKKADKYPWWVKLAGADDSGFATVSHEHHRLRRSALAPYFSTRSVISLEPVIREKVEKLSKRLERIAETGEVVKFDVAFTALTIDVISDYAFGADRKYLDEEDFNLLWFETVRGGFQNLALAMFFPWLLPVMKKLPLGFAAAANPTIGHMLRWQDGVKQNIREILESKDRNSQKGQEAGRTSIFHELRDHPDLPSEEKTLQRLCDEGEIMTGAGSETTAQTLTRVVFYLKHEHATLERLRQELDVVMKDPSVIPPWTELQQLPYLKAVVKEALRFQYGTTARLPRVLHHDLKYQDYVIPAGTPVSSTPYFVLTDPGIFPDPGKFRPERWLDEGNRLDTYLVGFGKGTRQCLGMNLAYAELYLTISMLARRFDWDLYDTKLEDVLPKHDFFVAVSDLKSKGVRAKMRFLDFETRGRSDWWQQSRYEEEDELVEEGIVRQSPKIETRE